MKWKYIGEGGASLEDQLITQLFYNRSEQAIKSLSEKYGRLCKTISYKILRNDQDAEECVNDTYLVAWNTIPPQRPDPLSAYICRITRNVSLKKYRSNTAEKRNSYYDVTLEEISECFKGKEQVEDNFEVNELSECINQFLDTIKPIDRVIFMERYWFCYEISEITKNLGLSKNYVNVHLHRTKEKLKKHLNLEGYYDQ